VRIRRKKWAKEELDNSKFYIDKPEMYKGIWASKFSESQQIHIELGCGKGIFISKLAFKNQNINYIAIDMIEAMLGLSKRNIEIVYGDKDPDNLLLIRVNIEQISNVFDREDIVDRIYINFCNPWPKGQHHKRRLTHTRQLEQYKTFLRDGGEIYIKTDDDELFESSLIYLDNSGFEITKKTYDLNNDNIFIQNIRTEHEEMFLKDGTKIKALIATKKAEIKKF